MQSLPRTILLDKTGRQLVQWPIREVEKLRVKEVKLHNKELKGGSVLEITNITAAQVTSLVLSQ